MSRKPGQLKKIGLAVAQLEYAALNKYVNSVADLVEYLNADIAGDGYISNETVLAANEVVLAAHALEEVFDTIDALVEEDNRKLN